MDDDNHDEGTTYFPSFRVWLCGTFRVERRVGSGYELIRTTEWGGSSYPRLLLKALLCCPGRQARRDALLEMLWPDAELEQAVQSLNTAVTRLRRVLTLSKGEASLLLTDDDSRVYRLAEQSLLWADMDAALARLGEAERYRRAFPEALALLEEVESYLSKGMILQDEEGPWAAGRRATVEQARYQCRLWLAEAYEQHQMPGQAGTALSLLFEEDPTDEDVLCRLLLLFHRQGMTHQALRLYEHAGQILEKEGMELAEATRTLVERLRQERWFSLRARPGKEEGLSFFPSLFSLAPHVQDALFGQTFIVEEPDEKLLPRPTVPSLRGEVIRHTPVLPAQEKAAPPKKLIHSSMEDLFDVGIQALFLVGQQERWSANEMHSILGQTLKKYSDMTWEEQKEKAVSRRDVLMLLTGMSGALLGLNDGGDTSPFFAEDSLSLCFTAIPACWSLVYAGGLPHIEQVLPRHLTHVTRIAQRSSPHQKLAASLASQGYKLANLLALRREDFITAFKHSQDALIYGQLAGDLHLQLAALIEEALTFWYRKRPLQTLETYQRALELMPKKGQASGMHHMISPILAGRIYVGLAEAYAQLEQEQEALQYIGLAQDTFPGDPENDPHFAYTHYDHYYLYLYQGLMYMKLNQPDQALSAYAHFNNPKYASRRAEITNREAAALFASGDMDQCCDKVDAAVALAVTMDSDLRYSEAHEVYQGMLIKWPHERKVKHLAQLFQR